MFSPLLEIAIGVITMWSGAIGNIPPGWQLCDGTNGTPDLRDRFLVSAGPNFSVDDTGSGQPHQHTLTSVGHFHRLTGGTDLQPVVPYSLQTDTVALTGSTDPHNALPPYFALAYIQYLGV